MSKKIQAIDLDHSNLSLSTKYISDYMQKRLISNFIEANKLICFYAKAGNGKSITALFLAVYLLKIGAVKKVYYIDADNGIGTLKNRGLDRILAEYPNLTYISFSKKVKEKDLDTRSIIFTLSKFANDEHKDALIVFDSMRNFIKGSMSLDEVVMPYLTAMQEMRNYYAGVWFLHHQNKQSFSDKDNKEHKGSTAFIDSSDEAYYVKKRERNGSQLIVTLEPQKGRDDTAPQAVILDTAELSVSLGDFYLYDLNDEQKQALEYTKEIIAKNPSGINLQNLTNEIKRLAKIDETQVCGAKAIKFLLKRFDGRFYTIETSNQHNQTIFKML